MRPEIELIMVTRMLTYCCCCYCQINWPNVSLIRRIKGPGLRDLFIGVALGINQSYSQLNGGLTDGLRSVQQQQHPNAIPASFPSHLKRRFQCLFECGAARLFQPIILRMPRQWNLFIFRIMRGSAWVLINKRLNTHWGRTAGTTSATMFGSQFSMQIQ